MPGYQRQEIAEMRESWSGCEAALGVDNRTSQKFLDGTV